MVLNQRLLSFYIYMLKCILLSTHWSFIALALECFPWLISHSSLFKCYLPDYNIWLFVGQASKVFHFRSERHTPASWLVFMRSLLLLFHPSIYLNFYIYLGSERNWNMALPGFGGEEIRTFKKPVSFLYISFSKYASRKSFFAYMCWTLPHWFLTCYFIPSMSMRFTGSGLLL